MSEYTQSILDWLTRATVWILRNKSWLFDGAGFVVFGWFFWLLKRLWNRRSRGRDSVKVHTNNSKKQYRTRREVAKALKRLHERNLQIWNDYGPDNENRHNPESDTANVWRRKVKNQIIPNNKSILAICDENVDKLRPEELATLERYRQHVLDMEDKHLNGAREGGTRFPKDVLRLFS